MVHAGDFTKEKPKPALVIFPKRAPLDKIYGFDAPEIRGAVILKENMPCPNCGRKKSAVLERSWIGGLGWVVSLVCEAGCGENGRNYWERNMK